MSQPTEAIGVDQFLRKLGEGLLDLCAQQRSAFYDFPKNEAPCAVMNSATC